MFGMDAHARPIAVKGIDRNTDATATKRFDDVPVPFEIASWMQSGLEKLVQAKQTETALKVNGLRPRIWNCDITDSWKGRRPQWKV